MNNEEVLEETPLIETIQPKKEYLQLFAVYGTLRLGQRNWRWCLSDADYLGTIKTEPEYTMYSLGGFPAIAEGGETAITIDVFGVEEQRIIDSVNSLEGYTGVHDHPRNWYNAKTIETPWGPAEIFIMNAQRERNRNEVESGDWLEYIKNR